MRRTLCLIALALSLALPARGEEVAALQAALAAAAARDWDGALAQAEGAVGRDVIQWMRLRAGEGTLTEYEDFIARRPDWPGLPLLREKGETAVARSTTPDRVIRWFAADKPATPAGAMALMRALAAAGRPEEARAEARRAWLFLSFDAGEEQAFLTLAGEATDDAHAARTNRLLWEEKVAEARRMLPRLAPGPRALAAARLALLSGADGVNDLIAQVPDALRADPGLAHDRFQWRMDRGLYDGAADLIVQASDAGTLGRPQDWAKRRAALARELAEIGQPQRAWRVAAGHGLTDGPDFLDLEFLAGFLALRDLNQPELALRHFRRLAEVAETPISASRAAYWQARAEEAQGRAEAATALYRAAARHQTAYYGLLAAERLGLALDPALLSDARPEDWRNAAFAGSSVLQAGRLLLRAGDRTLGKRFLLHLAESLDSDQTARLADMARIIGEPHVSLVLAKRAGEKGALYPALHHPVSDLVPEGLAVSRAFALAIARRESEFDIAAVSPAGALGLMQLMPATAQAMAGKTGQTYARDRLTTDSAYNTALGAAYLRQLIDEFGPAVALVAAGYNAGPGRPRRWITTFGDPRSPAVDVIDWVERIPISETRTYVMRVAESLVIYRAKLRGTTGPVRLTAELTGR
jgi:soluble lytic murein transglycosylase